MAATRTWQDASQEILDRLDLAAEYHAMGVETYGQLSATGWLSCKVYGADEANPSAGICIAGEHPTRGRYKEHTGDGRSLSFWDFCVLAGRFATWQAAREHYRAKTGVSPAANAPRDPNSQLHFRDWNRALVNTWCLKKPPITQEAVFLAGGCMAEWPAKSQHHIVIALPVYGWPLRVEAPTGWVIWNKSGRDLPLWQGKDKPPRPVKMLSVSGTRSGLMGRHGLENLPAAELVWKVEGPSDMLALMSVMPAELRDKHAVVANSGGAMEQPRPEILPAFEGRKVAVVGDADTPGQAGARRWAEAIAAVAAEVRMVTLPYPIEESHGKDLRDWFREGGEYK